MNEPSAPIRGADAPARRRPTWWQKFTLAVLAAASAALAAMSFSGMFTAVRGAMIPFLGAGAWMIPVGTDLGIVITSAFSVVLEWMEMTAGAVGARVATLVFIGLQLGINVGAAHGDPLGSAGHAVLPALFITIMEIWQYIIRRLRKARAPKPGKQRERIPLARYRADWDGSRELRRFMILWGIDRYSEALDTMQRVQRAKASLAHVYGDGWRNECPADILLMLGTAKFLDEAIAEIAKIRAAFDKGHNLRNGWQQRAVQAGISTPSIPAPNSDGNGKSTGGAGGSVGRAEDCQCTVHRAKALAKAGDLPLPLPIGDAPKVWAEWMRVHPGQQLGADPLRIVFGIGMQPARELRDKLKGGAGSGPESGSGVRSGPDAESGRESVPQSGEGIRPDDSAAVGSRVLAAAGAGQ